MNRFQRMQHRREFRILKRLCVDAEKERREHRALVAEAVRELVAEEMAELVEGLL